MNLPIDIVCKILPRISDDERGVSVNFTAESSDFLGEIKDIHYASILPGKVRGNHYHIDRKEIILVDFTDEWVLASQTSQSSVTTRKFSGVGLALIKVESMVTHAIKNTGQRHLTIVAICNTPFRPEETIPNIILN